MPITIGSNIASLTAQRRLTSATQSVGSALERLGSGMRINRASDDAAGLAVSTALNASARTFTQAIRNVNDGVSFLSIAESALQALSDITTRQMELAESAANGTYSLIQREALNAEANELVEEYNRIVQSTQFNGRFMFNDPASGSTVDLQVGIDSSGGLRVDIGGSSGISRAIGLGTFTSGDSIARTNAGGHFGDFIAGDFNQDGKTDILYSTGGGAVEVTLGNGDGTFQTATSFDTGLSGSSTVASGDWNGDGITDLVVEDYSSNNIAVMFGSGSGTFQSIASFLFDGNSGSGLVPSYMSSGDLNGDGLSDLLLGDGYVTSVRLSLGDGTFSESFSTAGQTGMFGGDTTAIADYNNDGLADIAVTDTNTGDISILSGDGNGQFTPSSLALTSTYVFAASGDFNNDGFMDLAIHNSSSGLSVLIGNGDATFNVLDYNLRDFSDSNIISAGDRNGDGIADITLLNGDNTTSILLGRSEGVFNMVEDTGITREYGTRLFADINGDDVYDLLISDYAGANPISVYIADTTQTSNISSLDLRSASSAREALSQLQQQMQGISTQIGSIGAAQSRLSVALETIAVSRENYYAAASRITDADVASESAALTLAGILQQAAAAVLAQANQQPALAISLLR